tara:strand:+ start:1 stop:1086 length:1086 start_codon:yes stop_codon:yes gene_type:complete
MYSPNFNDPRVQRRVKRACGFVSALTSPDKARWLSTRFIDKHLGSQRNTLSKFLRSNLLVCVDETYDMDNKRCKEYVLNETGLSNLLDLLDKKNHNKTYHITYPSVVDLCSIAVEWGKTTYEEQLDSLNFEYVEKQHRLYNDIQNIRSDARCKLLADRGLKYDYDIDTAAPTLLYQYSHKTPSATGEVCSVIEYYIDNKDHVRNQLSKESGLPLENIKKIINAHFSGGFLTTYRRSQVYKMCDYDDAVVKFLQQHDFIIGLKADIKKMWDPIKADIKAEYYWTKTNKWRKRAFSPRSKWNIYFSLERMILNEVIAYCRELKCNTFLEHDGFRTDNKIDTDDLSLYVREGTGYTVKFKEVLH